MSKIFAGVAVFPAGVNEYNISISLISSPKGSVIDNKSTSSPVKITSLKETVRSMILSALAEPLAKTIKSNFTSVPLAFPPDRCYDVFKALKLARLIERWECPALPLNHGEAFSSTLPKGKTITVLALDLSSPNLLYAAILSSTEADGKRVNTIINELSVSLTDDNSFRGALGKILESPKGTSKMPEQIMLIRPTISPKEAGAVDIDIDGLVAELYPNVPVSIATSNDIAQAAASFAYASSLLYVPHKLVQYCMVLPVSVATASGTVVPLTLSTIRIPLHFFITLTNSVDNQRSVTVRLLLGNHSQAKNNLQRAVVVLDGLKPLPKGEARIKVWIKVLDLDGWREAVRIAIEQKDGPKKKFLFPRFSADLPEDYEEKFSIPVKEEKDPLPWSDNVVGKLPE